MLALNKVTDPGETFVTDPALKRRAGRKGECLFFHYKNAVWVAVGKNICTQARPISPIAEPQLESK